MCWMLCIKMFEDRFLLQLRWLEWRRDSADGRFAESQSACVVDGEQGRGGSFWPLWCLKRNGTGRHELSE